MKRAVASSVRRHVKTTGAGVLGLIFVGYALYHDPSAASDPVKGPMLLATAATSLGNIFSADASEVKDKDEEQ